MTKPEPDKESPFAEVLRDLVERHAALVVAVSSIVARLHETGAGDLRKACIDGMREHGIVTPPQIATLDAIFGEGDPPETTARRLN
jgi:hypothetical protein